MKCLKIVALACVAAVTCLGCGGTSVDDFSFGNLFSDVPSSPVKIINNTDQDLLLIKGDLDPKNALGGVPKGETFGIRQVDGFYLLRAISRQQAESLYPDFSSARVVYATLVYIASDWTTNTIEIPANSTASVVFDNQSSEYIDIAKDSWYGSSVTTLGPKEVRRYYLPPADYRFFPSRISTVYSGSAIVGFKKTWLKTSADLINLTEGVMDRQFTIPATVPSEEVTAYLYVKNNYTQGVNFLLGNVVKKSTLNREIINRDGGTQIFEFKPNTSMTFSIGIMAFANVQGVSVASNLEAVSLSSGDKRYFVIDQSGVLNVNAAPF